MGEAFFWALETRLPASRPGSTAPPAPHRGGNFLSSGAAADDTGAASRSAELHPEGAVPGDAQGAAQDGAALSRAEFEALVGQELRIFAYNRPHHALDFRIACSCAPSRR